MSEVDTKPSEDRGAVSGGRGPDRGARAEAAISEQSRDKLRASSAPRGTDARPDPAASQARLAATGQPAQQRVIAEIAAFRARSPDLQGGALDATPAVMTGPMPDIMRVDSAGTLAQDACFCPATSGLQGPNERPDLPPPPPLADFRATAEAAGMPNLELTDGLREAAAHLGVELTTPRELSAARAYEFAAGATRDLMGARAFQNATGLPFDPANVVEGGVHRNALLETIAQMEFDAPGTFMGNGGPFGATLRNMGEAFGPAVAATLEAVDRGYLPAEPGALIGEGLTTERRGIFPATSTTSDRARAAAIASGAQLPQNWQAHHKIPYGTLLSLPFETQLAIAESGWALDSPANIVPLPADENSYRALPNNGRLPMHRGAHPNYSAIVRLNLAPLSDGILMGNHSNYAIRQQLNEIGALSMAETFNPFPGNPHPFHIRLN